MPSRTRYLVAVSSIVYQGAVVVNGVRLATGSLNDSVFVDNDSRFGIPSYSKRFDKLKKEVGFVKCA